MKLKYTIATLAVTTMAVNAAITATKDAANFDYIYNQDVDSSSLDLDSNTTADFFTGNAAEHPAISASVASFTSGDFYRTDFGGSIDRANFTATSGYTIEIEAQILGTGAASGSNGTMAIFWRFGTGNASITYIDDSGMWVSDGGTKTQISTADNTDAMHTYRMAGDGTEFSVWRDGVLLGLFSEANAGTNQGLYLGDSGSTNSGDWNMNHMALSVGGFAPVPEPSSTALLGLGGLALILRRRK